MKKVKISCACPINWETMQSLDDKTKFCGSCKMKVQDFTKDTELNMAGVHCGRFRMDQVERINRTFSFNPRQVFAVSLFSLLGMTAPLAAQTANDFKTAQSIIAEQSIVTLSGTVIDSINNEGIPFGNVVVKKADGSIIGGGSTDFDGVFKIILTKDLLSLKGVTIEISALGYANTKFGAPEITSDVLKLEVSLSAKNGDLEVVHVMGGCTFVDYNGAKTFNREDIHESPYRQ